MIYRFGSYSLDPERLELRDNETLISVEPQVFALLTLLINHRDKVVTKDEIIEKVWDGRIVSDGTLNSRINAARRVLGDDGKEQKIIKTFPRKGFRFIAKVQPEESDEQKPITDVQTSDKPSIAVLPFLNLSGDAEQEYFADGITEDLIAALGRIRQLSVIARNTAFTFKSQSITVQTIAQELGVRYVLEGSVRKSGNRVRITAQLSHGPSGSHIWAEQYDRNLEDIFELQDEITQAVVAAVEPTMAKIERDRAIFRNSENLDAWDYYHRGMSHLFDKGAYGQSDELLHARQAFKKSIELDENFSRAYYGLSLCSFYTAIIGPWNNLRSTLEEGFEAAKLAVELDQQDAEARSILGLICFWKRDPQTTVRECRMALEINPTFSRAYCWLGQAKICSGSASEGTEIIEAFLKIGQRDPHRGPATAWLSLGYLFLGSFEKAEDLARRSLANPNTQYWGNIVLTAALSHQGRNDEAVEALKILRQRKPDLTCKLINNLSPITDSEYMALLLAGLRKAGLPE